MAHIIRPAFITFITPVIDIIMMIVIWMIIWLFVCFYRVSYKGTLSPPACKILCLQNVNRGGYEGILSYHYNVYYMGIYMLYIGHL